MRNFGITLLIVLLPAVTWAKTFHCPAEDVSCLITAINQANANGQKNTITLDAGTYTLTDADNDTGFGLTGFPSITSTLTIRGKGRDISILTRDVNMNDVAHLFRLVRVAAAGVLTLKKLTIHGGDDISPFGGGGLLNQGGTVNVQDVVFSNNFTSTGGGGLHNNGGTVTISQTLFTDNGAPGAGGGLYSSGGTVSINHTTFEGNAAEVCGGIVIQSGGTMTITNSAIVDNFAGPAGGGGICNNKGLLTLTNSTMARNSGGEWGGNLFNVNAGTTVILNSTITENVGGLGGPGGILNSSGSVTLQNTILAGNRAVDPGIGPECSGVVTSLGNNLIGDPTGCTITLQPSDLTGDPGLGDLSDDGTPGNAHFPLLSTSQAINAGNDAACPKRDQLGDKRKECDIGAIEFQKKKAQQEGLGGE